MSPLTRTADGSHAHHAMSPKRSKLDSSPRPGGGGGGAVTARGNTSRPRLHKHSSSTSSASGVVSPARLATPTLLPSRSTPVLMAPQPVAQVDFRSTAASSIFMPSTPARTKTKTKIKPLLRKLTPQDSNSLDLDRSATEYEGLGIYRADGRPGARTAAEVSFAGAGGRKALAHHRSTSAASQFSTATTASAGRPYVHPMRQTPRPFTPPIAQSYTTSLLGSEVSGEGVVDAASPDEERLRQLVRDATHRGGPMYASPPLPLQLDTGISATRPATDSPTNLSGTPSTSRPRADTLSPVGTISPTSRSSIDMAFKLRRRDSPDPASRAASIRAARQAFSEREAAKAEKAEREEQRRHQRREKRGRRDRSRSNATSSFTVTEKDDPLRATAYSTLPPSAPRRWEATDPAEAGARPSRRPTMTSTKGSVKNSWVGFMIWLKTRLLHLGRMMKGRSR